MAHIKSHMIRFENYSDFIETQKILLKRNYMWVGINEKSIFYGFNNKTNNIIFPRCVEVFYYNENDENGYIFSNLENDIEYCLKNRHNLPIVCAKSILRKEKFKKLTI